MTPWVIDSSVACKLLLPEDYSGNAIALLESAELYAPDFLLIEVANVLWKRANRGELDIVDAQTRLMRAVSFPIKLRQTAALLYAALEIAVATGRTVYDCSYIALAKALNAPCVTADERLFNALSATPYQKYVLRLADQ
jgi:predicted nucleic acid-binding protein